MAAKCVRVRGGLAYVAACVARTTWFMPDGSGDRFPEDYERGRLGWPHEAVELLDLPPTTTALDLGAGTGKLTRLLVEGFDRVVAVEPAAAMRRVLVTLCPQAEICAGQARSIPLRDRSAGAVFAAEAFHWFDDDHALAEIARVLRVDAPLLLLWNLPAGPWEPSITSAEALLRARLPEVTLDHDPLDLDGPRRGDGEWRGSFVGAGFEPLRDTRIPNEQTLDRDGLVSFFASMGWIADMDDQERLPLLAEVRSLLGSSTYRRRWITHAFWARLRPH
jgi:SAM-dependent methyltransferase